MATTIHDLPAAITVARTRLSQQQSRRLRLETELAAGLLIEEHPVRCWVAQSIIATRDVILTTPDILAGMLPPECRYTVRAAVDKILRDLLTKLARDKYPQNKN